MSAIGFTGTQEGLTKQQTQVLKEALEYYIELGWHTQFHHGDCIGADREFHNLAKEYGFYIVLHPPDISTKRAFCSDVRFTYPVKPYLERNHDIVNSSDVLIVCPKTKEEVIRSGTWATYRYANKLNKSILLVEP